MTRIVFLKNEFSKNYLRYMSKSFDYERAVEFGEGNKERLKSEVEHLKRALKRIKQEIKELEGNLK